MTGRVVSGSRNIFVVKTDNAIVYECRIKGKVLKNDKELYNPIAPGDIVEFDTAGQICGVVTRRNLFTRFNVKGNAPQLLAANIDVVFCFITPASPPFRPRFLDRLLLQADAAEIPAIILCNKIDLLSSIDDETRLSIERRLSDFERLGYEVMRISVKTGEGVDALKSKLKMKSAALLGHSGCGKTSLINALLPNAKQKTGALNQKYDRGNHTTVMSVLFENNLEKFSLIDTPGIRRFVPEGIEPEAVQNLMRDFAPFAGKCAFGLSCAHKNEAGCKIQEALKSGAIHEDRFESFIRIKKELSDISAAVRRAGDSG
ncbi:MAG: ribosome small subunit-dependent GTPase A [Spirochaetaceae bacterium]|jgi:ribosome biogenesis GTPase|nr:ribosome small subunit-dependent GTPase A [Spirochaetaceae bacterium]